ncbi:MAG: hypothetical protein J6J31_02515 [Thermoguttaceae bacterium]|nr:hypothetical protein [Thermoguttaceae bacterium]
MKEDPLTYAQLQTLAESLRKEVSELFLEYDELIHFKKPAILAKYLQAVGELENACSERTEEVRWLKRKITLFLRSLNRGEKPDEDAIDDQLEKERDGWKDSMKKDTEWFTFQEELSKEQKADLKKKYFSIMRDLHPDLNPDRTDVQERFMEAAQEAFETMDYDVILGIFHLVRPIIPAMDASGKKLSGDAEEKAFRDLCTTRKQLLKTRVRLLKRLEFEKNSYPLKFEAFLQDEDAVAEYRETLEKQLEFLEAAQERCEDRLEELRAQCETMEDDEWEE